MTRKKQKQRKSPLILRELARDIERLKRPLGKGETAELDDEGKVRYCAVGYISKRLGHAPTPQSRHDAADTAYTVARFLYNLGVGLAVSDIYLTNDYSSERQRNSAVAALLRKAAQN